MVYTQSTQLRRLSGRVVLAILLGGCTSSVLSDAPVAVPTGTVPDVAAFLGDWESVEEGSDVRLEVTGVTGGPITATLSTEFYGATAGRVYEVIGTTDAAGDVLFAARRLDWDAASDPRFVSTPVEPRWVLGKVRIDSQGDLVAYSVDNAGLRAAVSDGLLDGTVVNSDRDEWDVAVTAPGDEVRDFLESHNSLFVEDNAVRFRRPQGAMSPEFRWLIAMFLAVAMGAGISRLRRRHMR